MSNEPTPADASGVSRRKVLQTGAIASGSALLGSTATADTAAGVSQQETVSLGCGDAVRGELTTEDETGFRSDRHYHDTYEFEGEQGAFVSISMSVVYDGQAEPNEDVIEPRGDPYLYLLGPDGNIVAEDDDSGGFLDSHITVPRLPETGAYTIVATSFRPADFFEYELTLQCS